MAKDKKLGSIKRFGARYGRTIKEKFGKIEEELKRKHKCPYCNSMKAKRAAVGIWTCGKCGSKFTGKAYTITHKAPVETVPDKETPEEVSDKETPEKEIVAEE